MLKKLLAVTALGATMALSAGTIKIGAIVSATGPASFLGDPELKTLQLYIDKINKNGGVNGDTLELVHYDSGANPKKAVTFTKRLIQQDEVVAIIGPSTSGATLAAMKFAQRAKVPMLSMAGSIKIIDPVQSYIFKIVATDRMACERIMQDLKDRNLKNLAMISGNGGFGKSMRAQCLDVSKSFGINIVADETYGAKDADMTAQLIKIKNTKNVDAVLNPGFGQGPAIVTKNYKQVGLTQPLYQSHGVASKKFIEIAGDAAEGVRLVAPPVVVADKLADDNPIKKVCVAYKNEFEKAYNTQVASFGGHAYSALHAIVEAIKTSGSTKPKDIRDAVEKLKDFVVVDGIVNMSPKDHLGLDTKSGMVLIDIKNGDWSVVK